MPRRKSEQMTPLELEIMQVLWETGPATVQTVQKQLKRELAYTTVQTMLTVLHRKNKVKRTLKDKAYIYRPAVSRNKFTGHAVREFIDRLFGGSAEGLAMNLLQEKHLTPERLAKLHALVEKEERDAEN
jgi:BlaI family penicillinase repressor